MQLVEAWPLQGDNVHHGATGRRCETMPRALKYSIDDHFQPSVIKMIITCLAHHLFRHGDECSLSTDTPEGWRQPPSFIYWRCVVTTYTAKFYQKIGIFYFGSHHLKVMVIFLFKIRAACVCKWVDKCDFDFDVTWQVGRAERAADPQGREFKCLNSKHVCLVCQRPLEETKVTSQTCCEATIP